MVFLVWNTSSSTGEYSRPSANLLELLFHKMWGRQCGGGSLWHRRKGKARSSQPAVSTSTTQPELGQTSFPSLLPPSPKPPSLRRPSVSGLLPGLLLQLLLSFSHFSTQRPERRWPNWSQITSLLCHHPPSPSPHSMIKPKSLQWPHGV